MLRPSSVRCRGTARRAPLSGRKRRGKELEMPYPPGLRPIRVRPGRMTTKLPLSRAPSSLIRLRTAFGNSLRAFAGNRMKMTPPDACAFAYTSWPKSLSSVRRMRPSRTAKSITAGSSALGDISATARTSCPAARNARTTAKSQLSSARKRTGQRLPRFRAGAGPSTTVSSCATVSAA